MEGAFVDRNIDKAPNQSRSAELTAAGRADIISSRCWSQVVNFDVCRSRSCSARVERWMKYVLQGVRRLSRRSMYKYLSPRMCAWVSYLVVLLLLVLFDFACGRVSFFGELSVHGRRVRIGGRGRPPEASCLSADAPIEHGKNVVRHPPSALHVRHLVKVATWARRECFTFPRVLSPLARVQLLLFCWFKLMVLTHTILILERGVGGGTWGGGLLADLMGVVQMRVGVCYCMAPAHGTICD